MKKKKLKGKKFDNNKSDISLIPYECLEEIAQVLMFGASIYGRYNWEQGLNYSRVASAAYRHIGKFMDLNQTLDQELTCKHCIKNICKKHSQRHHIAAAIANLLFLLSYDLNNRKELDNRRKKYECL